MAIRTLIADDDSTIRMLLRRLLEGRSDWRVCSEAVNGVEAIEKVEVFAPDLAILDLGMPIMNGVQAPREISKANPTFRCFSLGCRKCPVNSQTP